MPYIRIIDRTCPVTEEGKDQTLDSEALDKVSGGTGLGVIPVIKEHDYDEEIKKKIK